MARSACMLALLAAALSVGACGGSSDDPGDTSESPVSGAVIDSQSAPFVAATVVTAVAGSQDLGTIGGFSVPGTPTGYAGSSKDVPQVLAATFGPETTDCAVGGSITLSGAQAVPQSVTVGDTLLFEFADCDNGDGAVVDGWLEFEIVSFSGDLATEQITLTVSMTLDSLRFGVEAAEGAMNGNLSFTIDTKNVPETFLALSGTQFSIETPVRSMTLSDYIATIVIDPLVGRLTLDSSATLLSSSFDGEISYVTTESLIFASDGRPVSGEIVVTGAENATLTISVLSADHIELEIDVDGNGTVDELIVTTWAGLTD